MNNLEEKTEQLGEHVKKYLETFYKLITVQATKKGTSFAALAITAFFLLLLTLFFILFLAIACAKWLGNIWNNEIAGYLGVAGFFLLLLIITLIISKKFLFPYFRNEMVKKFYADK